MTVLYRKYRPQKFADLIGQENIAKTLLAQLESGKISHGYLFVGSRGTGKTSTARILAKAVNCEVYGKTTNDKQSAVNHFGEPCDKCNACQAITNGSYLDLIEIDAASNRGIDEIRDLREKIRLSPVSGRYKVYIIDEVHMLTSEAFNALLKTLEEPPAHAIFILCTTAPEKIPATIISRLSRFNFKRASADDLSRSIEKIAKREDIKIEKDAIAAIAKTADGSYRDALSILDQLASGGKAITQKDVGDSFTITSSKALFDFLDKVFTGDLAGSVLAVEEISASYDTAVFIRDAIFLLKKILYIKIGIKVSDVDNLEELEELVKKASYLQIQNLMRLLLIAEGEIKLYPLPEIALTLAVCKFLPEAGGEKFTDSAGLHPTPTSSPALSNSDVHSESKTDLPKVLDAGARIEAPRPSPAGREEDKVLGKKSTKDLAEVEAKWGEFLAKVKPINAHVFALLRSTRPTGFDGATLILEVFFKFHKEKLEEPKIMNLLCDSLENVLGKPVALRLVLAARETKPTKTVTISDVAEIADDELSQMAVEIFSK